MALLTLEGVSKSFGDITAVDGVTFGVDRGEVVGFLGPNGAGKSTTMRMVTQYLDPDGGEIRVDGVSVEEDPLTAKRRIGYLPENNPLYTDMMVQEYLAFVAELRGLEGQDAARAIDDAVGATAVEQVYYRPIGELSKGFRQRVGLAQAILHRPDLLVLDEPTEGLDPSQRLEIRHLIEHLGSARTVILSTHVLSEVRQTCTRLLIINRGKIVADGPVDDLVAQASGVRRIVVEAEGQGVADGLGSLSGVQNVVSGQPGAAGRVAVTITTGGAGDLRPEIFAMARDRNWVLYELHQEAGSLEDLFLELTTGEPDPEPEPEPVGEPEGRVA
jgi:ABC-2 type transport system ATP-binding protein